MSFSDIVGQLVHLQRQFVFLSPISHNSKRFTYGPTGVSVYFLDWILRLSMHFNLFFPSCHSFVPHHWNVSVMRILTMEWMMQ